MSPWPFGADQPLKGKETKIFAMLKVEATVILFSYVNFEWRGAQKHIPSIGGGSQKCVVILLWKTWTT